MATRTSILLHLGRKLTPVRIVVTIVARLLVETEASTRSSRFMALAARHGLVLSLKRERRMRMRFNTKLRWPKPMFCMTAGAIAVALKFLKLTSMHIFMAVGAVLELQLTKPFVCRKAWSVTAVARNARVHPLQGKRSARMRF